MFSLCRHCGKNKPKEDFQEKGHQCRDCRNKKIKNWHKKTELTEKQKQDRRDAAKRWRERNLESAIKSNRNTMYRKKYGITLYEYNEMLKSQNGVCAICLNFCDTGMNLAVDHDHNTGKIRALLCKNCNTAIGLFKENTNYISRAIEYLEFNSVYKEVI